VNEPQVILDSIPGIFWNLAVPALAWALVIAGLTWTIRDRIRRHGFDPSQEQGPSEDYQASNDSVVVNQLSEYCICCRSIVCDKPSERGKETCIPKK
jgi:hypothetical protein